VQALLAKGVEVVAIAPEDEYSQRLISWGCRYIPVKIENKGSNPWNDLKFLFRLYSIYKTVRPDVVLHYTIKPNIYGTLAARLAKVTAINNVSGLGTVFLHQNLTSFIAKKLYRLAFKFPVKIFFQNKEDRELFVDLKLVAQAKTALLPGSGVNTEKFSVLEKQKQKTDFIFLMVARLLYDKGIVEYIEAIRQLKKENIRARFQVVGAIDESANLGVSMEKVKEWVAEGLLEYFPFTDRLIEFYHQADCVVLPSYREGTPRSLLEGAACGKPLIATDVPGCREVVVDGKNGYLCNVKDPSDLADKMKKMIHLEEQEYRSMAVLSRKYILENFDENLVINAYFSAINSIITI